MRKPAPFRRTGPGASTKAFLFLSLFCGFLCSLNAGSNFFIGKCTGIADGDTIDASRDGATIRIRLEGIDCPEQNQPFAEEAKAFTARLIAGKTVAIVEKEKDTYGRTVARVFVDGRDVSVELLKAGLATHYKKYNSDWLLAALQEEAKAERAGMWASSTTIPPAEKPVPIPARVAGGTAGVPGETSQITYHGNTNSRVFHAPSCRNYSCKNCTRIFRS
jgi:micrococcal nuclease